MQKVNKDVIAEDVSNPIYWVNNKLFEAINEEDVNYLKLTDVAEEIPQTVTFSRKDKNSFKVDTDFDGAEVTDDDAKRIISGLNNLRFTNVKNIQDVKDDMQTVFKSEISLSNGDITIINFVKVGKTEIWLEVLSTNKRLSAKYDGWLYLFPWRQIFDIMPEHVEGVDENV